MKFQKTFQKVLKLEYTPETQVTPKLLLEYRWRLWNLAFCARMVRKLGGDFVECGVSDGLSSFVVLNEHNFDAHLYDVFGSLRESDLTRTPTASMYAGLSFDRTKRNLKGFQIKYHPGYIPETLDGTAPEKISLLHLDLTSPEAYQQALEFFYPRMMSSGVIIFDDFGHNGHQETNKIIRDFLNTKEGVLQILPTGQAIFYLTTSENKHNSI